jgi:hypothetical protein
VKKKYLSESPTLKMLRDAKQEFWAEHDNDVDKVIQTIKEDEARLRSEGVRFADSLEPSFPLDLEDRIANLEKDNL